MLRPALTSAACAAYAPCPPPPPQYHSESLTTFQNWPTQSTPLGHVTATGWSPTSEYLAMGNSKGRVLLYRIKAYAGF